MFEQLQDRLNTRLSAYQKAKADTAQKVEELEALADQARKDAAAADTPEKMTDANGRAAFYALKAEKLRAVTIDSGCTLEEAQETIGRIGKEFAASAVEDLREIDTVLENLYPIVRRIKQQREEVMQVVDTFRKLLQTEDERKQVKEPYYIWIPTGAFAFKQDKFVIQLDVRSNIKTLLEASGCGKN